MMKLTKIYLWGTWIFEELQTPDELDDVEQLPDESGFEFEVNVVAIGLWIVLADESQVLEEDEDN